MRISNQVQQALIDAIEREVAPVLGAQFRLFGSRVNSEKRGGDIDLLLETSAAQKAALLPRIAALRMALREAAGDQKVDLTVCTREERGEDLFLAMITETVELRRW